MSLFKRFKALLTMKAMDKMDSMENIDQSLNMASTQLMQEITKVKHSIADLVAAKARMTVHRDKSKADLVKLNDQAAEAITQGLDELAEKIAGRLLTKEAEVEQYTAAIDQLEEQQRELTEQEANMSAELTKFRAKAEMLKAQNSAAEAQLRIAEATSGIGGSMEETHALLERAVNRTADKQARASALRELAASGVGRGGVMELNAGDDIDRELRKAGGGDSKAQQRIAQMKADMGIKALDAGSDDAEVNLDK